MDARLLKDRQSLPPTRNWGVDTRGLTFCIHRATKGIVPDRQLKPIWFAIWVDDDPGYNLHRLRDLQTAVSFLREEPGARDRDGCNAAALTENITAWELIMRS